MTYTHKCFKGNTKEGPIHSVKEGRASFKLHIRELEFKLSYVTQQGGYVRILGGMNNEQKKHKDMLDMKKKVTSVCYNVCVFLENLTFCKITISK